MAKTGKKKTGKKKTTKKNTETEIKPLKGKQLLFAENYLKRPENQTQAYIDAGYKATGDSAKVSASQLLKNPNVAAHIERRRAELQEKADVELIDLIREVGRLALSDIRQLYDEKGDFLPIHELPDDIAAAVAGIEMGVEFDADKNPCYYIKKIRIWDKNPAQERLCKILGAFEKDNKQKTDPLTALMDAIDGKSTNIPGD